MLADAALKRGKDVEDVEGYLMKQNLILLIGRFSKSTGYSYAVKSCYDAMKKMGLKVIAIDCDLLDVVGPSVGAKVNIRRSIKDTQKFLEVTADDQDINFVTIFFDTPERYSCAIASGRNRLIGYTMFETESLPVKWYGPLLNLDEVWIPCEFNRKTFSDGGIPAFMLTVMPLTIDFEMYQNKFPKLGIPGLKDFVFSSVVSNFNRKDVGLLLRSYFKVFSSLDNVSLVIKTFPRSREDSVLFDRFVREAVRPEFDIDDAKLPDVHFFDSVLTSERMCQLYATTDVYVSTDRGTGWNLPAMESMAMGKAVISVNWSGSTDFMTEENSFLVEPLPQTVFVDPSLVKNLVMYAGHKWSAVNEDEFAQMMKVAYEDDALRYQKGERARRDIGENFDLSVIGNRIASHIASYKDHDFRSHTAPRLRLYSLKSELPVSSGDDFTVKLTSWLDELRVARLFLEVNEVNPVMIHRKLNKLVGALDYYKSLEKTLPAASPIKQGVEGFWSVPYKQVFRKYVQYLRIVNAAKSIRASSPINFEVPGAPTKSRDDITSDPNSIPLPPFEEGDDLEAWVEGRRQLSRKFNSIPPSDEELHRLRALKDAYAGERIFIVGNGPSLNHVDLDKLKNEYTFAVNKIYLMFDRTDWRPTFYTCIDWRVTPDIYKDVNNLRGMTFFFPNRFWGLLRTGDDVFWYHSKSSGHTVFEKFETDITRGVRGAGTVLLPAIQIAFYLGFREIYLIGVDANFVIPKSVIQSGKDRFGTGLKVNLESTEDDDPNHFDPRYFGRGAKWHDPNVNEMLRGFTNMRTGVEINGGKILNATIGGRLEVFERVNFDDLFQG